MPRPSRRPAGRILGTLQATTATLLLLSCTTSGLATDAPDPTTDAPQASRTSVDDPQPFGTTDDFAEHREDLVEYAIRGQGISDPLVVAAMAAVPRHEFIPEQYRGLAYHDRALPIGYGQTISQPYIVALMTEALQPEPEDKVLEIGTGSGYQAAVLSEIVREVHTIEIVGALAERASATLGRLGYDDVEVVHGDGYFGLEEHAPYDAIVVTAAPDHVPPPLRTQLKDGGRLVIPVGPVGGYQELWLVERHGDKFETSSLGGVVFVPLTRDVRQD
jgi:protein-L-isoaspartate(D-aspartate) O-methyltransferase